jgi:hypothetical protein
LGHMIDELAADEMLAALTSRDFARFAACLEPSAQARLLLPRGPEVRAGREEIARRFEGWFAAATAFEVLECRREPVGPRELLTWRFRLSRDGQTREVIEQVAFVDVGPDGISAIDLMCSGFHREGVPAASCSIEDLAARAGTIATA